MLELLAMAMWGWVASAQAAPVSVVTFDNGEFNLPLYTPRYNGRWEQPSVAQELISTVARVTGQRPRVYTYLPPGRAPARPGEAWPVLPRRPQCGGAARLPTDPCWCDPSDNCWRALAPSWYAEASTSLALTARTVRARLGLGARLEIHLTDLFEEDPGAAADPADSDRCVTEAGVRRAVRALLATREGEQLDHVAVGLLSASVDPPPPGSSWGYTFALSPARDTGCWRGVRTGEWETDRGAVQVTMAVLVLGFDTAADSDWVTEVLDGLEEDLDAAPHRFGLVRLRQPGQDVVFVRDTIGRDAALDWEVPVPAAAAGVPCGEVVGVADLRSGGVPLAVRDVRGSCAGGAVVRFARGALDRSFSQQAGLDPRRSSIEVEGRVTLTDTPAAMRAAFDALEILNEGDRPLPLFPVLAGALDLSAPAGPERIWQPWSQRVEVVQLRVAGMDQRPWLLVLGFAGLAGLLAAGVVSELVRRWQAHRALHAHWGASTMAVDALAQRPVALVISAAQAQVARRWPVPLLLGVVAGTAVSLLGVRALLWFHGVLLG